MLSNTILRGDTTTADTEFTGLIPDPRENIYTFIKLEENLIVPDSFDGKNVWKKYLSGVVNQKTCGSCWAFAAVTSLADRFRLHSNGVLDVELSPVPIVLCDTHGASNPEPLKDLETSVQIYETVQKLYGCNGNLLSEAWRMLYTLGTTSTQCMPLNILKYQSPSSCIKLMGPAGDMCSDYRFNYFNNIEYGTPAKFYNAQYVYAVPGIPTDQGSELSIRREIYKYGPVSTAMEIYPDFYTFNFTKGVYVSNYIGGRQTGHAVIIDGWGEEDGIKFWWIRNSWGKEWGIEGYFKMLRGTNHCKIEENVITGLPNITSAKVLLNDNINIPKDVENKFLLQSYQNMAGGIDPTTGYSRRILSYLKYKDDLNLKNVNISTPEYKSFVAGNLGENVTALSSSVDISKDKPNTDLILGLIIGMSVLGILCIICIAILINMKRY